MATPAAKVTNTPGFRTSRPCARFVITNGEKVVVKPVLYAGKHEGHGTYIAGKANDEIVCDKSGRPLPFRQIGFTELI
jgi:hypothetical protein